MKQNAMLYLAATGLILSSCTAIATGVGIGVGTAAVQEGGISRAASDLRIQTEINDLWFRHNISIFTKLDLTINQGRVLITGVVQDPEHRVEAVRMAWKPNGVIQVINEIKVAQSEGIIGYAKDSWISTRLRAALVMASEIESINYSIDTVQGSVYLMGFAQNQAELNQVIERARTIENVKQVVSYVKLVGAPDLSPVSNGQAGSDYSQSVNSGQSGAATGQPVQWNNNNSYD